MAKYFNKENVAPMLSCINWLKEKTGLSVYPVYGTLLGIMREKDFIEDDYDIDLAYLSKFHDIDSVIAEFKAVQSTLKEGGLLIKNCAPGQMHIGPWFHTIFDLWTAWVDQNGRYRQVFAVNGELTQDEVFPLVSVDFLGHKVEIPSGYARLNSLIYGSWEVRDPKFKHGTARARYLGK